MANFARGRHRGVTVFSATGVVTNVTLRQPGGSGAIVTLHGRFEIISLSGSFMPPPAPTGASEVNIYLVGGQGQVLGGRVVGPLFSSGPFIITAASFANVEYNRLPYEVKVEEEEGIFLNFDAHQRVDEKPNESGKDFNQETKDSILTQATMSTKAKPLTMISRDTPNVLRSQIIEVADGCDIVDNMANFARGRHRGVTVLSAIGVVANVNLRQPGGSGATVTLHGRFEIISLSGSFMPPPAPTGASEVSIYLMGGQGQVVGGRVVGPLFSSGPSIITAVSFANVEYNRLPYEVKVEEQEGIFLNFDADQRVDKKPSTSGKEIKNSILTQTREMPVKKELVKEEGIREEDKFDFQDTDFFEFLDTQNSDSDEDDKKYLKCLDLKTTGNMTQDVSFLSSLSNKGSPIRNFEGYAKGVDDEEDKLHDCISKKCMFKGGGICLRGVYADSDFCLAHATWKRCVFPGCARSTRGWRDFCVAHGGGKQCAISGCTRFARGLSGLCTPHGRGKRCAFQGCNKHLRGSISYCTAHSLRNRCMFLGCTRIKRRSSDFCIIHGGKKSVELPSYWEQTVPLDLFCAQQTQLQLSSTEKYCRSTWTYWGMIINTIKFAQRLRTKHVANKPRKKLMLVECSQAYESCKGWRWSLIRNVIKFLMRIRAFRGVPTFTTHIVPVDDEWFRTLDASLRTSHTEFVKSIEMVDHGETSGLGEATMEHALLYCSLFPKEYEFEKDMMVQLWVAEDLIKDEPFECIARQYFEQMLHLGYIQFSRMDLMTGNMLYKFKSDYCPDLSARISHIIIDSNLNSIDFTAEISHVAVKCSYRTDFTTLGGFNKLKRLKALMFLEGHKSSFKRVPREFFFSLEQLQVLDMSRTHIQEVPNSIASMQCLRYLDLSHTSISRLPEVIDNLSNLQTLRLKGCSKLFLLPKGIKKLIDLRHLDLDILRQLSSMPKGMGSLTKLQTLSGFLVGRDSECSIGQLRNMNNLTGSFCVSRIENILTVEEAIEACLYKKSQLTKLELRWSDTQDDNDDFENEKVLSFLKPNVNLEELRIVHYRDFEMPSWICDPAFSRLVTVTIFSCENCLALPSLGQLPALKFLNIVEFHTLKVIDHTFRGSGSLSYIAFPKLEKLAIENMDNLEAWNGIEEFDFPCLIKLTVKSCPQLCIISSLSYLRSLKILEISYCTMLLNYSDGILPASVETFIIEDCPLISSWIENNQGEDWLKVSHIPSVWVNHQERTFGDRSSLILEDEVH